MKRKHGSLGSFLAGAVTMLLLMGLVTGALATNAQKSATLYYSDIKVCLDGKVLKLADATGAEVEPFTISGTTYLPVRAISEALGLDVEWNGSSHTVYLTTKPGGSVDVAGERVSMGTLKAYSFSHKDDDGSANFDSTSSFTNRQTVYHPENRLYMAAGSGVLGWTKLKVPSTMSVTYLVNKEYKAFTAYAAAIDGRGDATFRFSDADTNIKLGEVKVEAGAAPVQVNIDLTGVDKLRISATTYSVQIGQSVYHRAYANGALYNAYLVK